MDSSQVRSAILGAPDDIRVVTRPRTRLEPGEVRVAVEQCGICDSDVRLWTGAADPATSPVQLGHEIAGRVTEVGGDVRASAVGDSVVVWVPSWVTVSAEERAVRGLAQEVVAQERHCIPVTKGCRFPFIAEPLGRLIRTLSDVKWPRGQNVVIVGGRFKALLATMLIAQELMPRSLTVFTSRSDALRLATEVGATHTASSPAELLSVIGQTDGHGADVVLELTGTQPGLDFAQRSARRGGTLLAGGRSVWPRQGNDDFLRERAIKMITADPADEAFRLQHTELALTRLDTWFDPSPLMGPSFPLGRIDDAFEAAGLGVQKVVVRP